MSFKTESKAATLLTGVKENVAIINLIIYFLLIVPPLPCQWKTLKCPVKQMGVSSPGCVELSSISVTPGYRIQKSALQTLLFHNEKSLGLLCLISTAHTGLDPAHTTSSNNKHFFTAFLLSVSLLYTHSYTNSCSEKDPIISSG